MYTYVTPACSTHPLLSHPLCGCTGEGVEIMPVNWVGFPWDADAGWRRRMDA